MDRLRATYGELLCSIAPGVDAEGDGGEVAVNSQM